MGGVLSESVNESGRVAGLYLPDSLGAVGGAEAQLTLTGTEQEHGRVSVNLTPALESNRRKAGAGAGAHNGVLSGERGGLDFHSVSYAGTGARLTAPRSLAYLTNQRASGFSGVLAPKEIVGLFSCPVAGGGGLCHGETLPGFA